MELLDDLSQVIQPAVGDAAGVTESAGVEAAVGEARGTRGLVDDFPQAQLEGDIGGGAAEACVVVTVQALDCAQLARREVVAGADHVVGDRAAGVQCNPGLDAEGLDPAAPVHVAAAACDVETEQAGVHAQAGAATDEVAVGVVQGAGGMTVDEAGVVQVYGIGAGTAEGKKPQHQQQNGRHPFEEFHFHWPHCQSFLHNRRFGVL